MIIRVLIILAAALVSFGCAPAVDYAAQVNGEVLSESQLFAYAEELRGNADYVAATSPTRIATKESDNQAREGDLVMIMQAYINGALYSQMTQALGIKPNRDDTANVKRFWVQEFGVAGDLSPVFDGFSEQMRKELVAWVTPVAAVRRHMSSLDPGSARLAGLQLRLDELFRGAQVRVSPRFGVAEADPRGSISFVVVGAQSGETAPFASRFEDGE